MSPADGFRRTAGAQRPGFTLIELVIVLACASLVAAAAVPGFERMRRDWTLTGAGHLVLQSMHWGRMHAVASNTQLGFEVAAGGKRFYWIDPTTGWRYESTVRDLPGDVRIVSAPRRPLRFHPRGNAAPAGSYVLEGPGGTCRVVVSPPGRIRFARDPPSAPAP